MSVETWTERASHGATLGAPDRMAAQPRLARLRPKLGLIDTLLQLWRAKWLMLLVFAPIALLGVAITLLTPTQYTASTRLLVRPGQEYVFDPIVGDAARAAFRRQEDVLQAESQLARSPVIAERTIRSIGLSRLYPDLADAKLRARDGDVYVIDQEALDAFAESLGVYTSPNSSILHMTFVHADPQAAADTLNHFVAEYRTYRREILSGGGAAQLSEQRNVVELRLQSADQALRDFLAAQGLSDYDVERAAATRLFGDISDEQTRVQASLREAKARSEGLARQMASTPREVDLYVETTSEQELVKLRLQREDLLTRYLPDSRAVNDVERRIAQLEAFLASAAPQGLRRIGPNPTWQAMEADRAQQGAAIAALNGRAVALATQLSEVESRIRQLDAIEPEYLRLKRDRDALEATAGAFASREQAELAERNVDNISVYESARAPMRGDAIKGAIAVTAAIFALLFALAAGLMRVWSVPGLATAAATERTLGLRVLAAVRER